MFSNSFRVQTSRTSLEKQTSPPSLGLEQLGTVRPPTSRKALMAEHAPKIIDGTALAK